jgi:uncharacterized protein (TIGR02246 family)
MRTPLTRHTVRGGILAAGAMALGAATVAAQGGMSPPEEAIVKIRNSYIESYNAKNGAAISKLYADDGMLVTAEGEVIRGPEAIAARFASLPMWPHLEVTPGKVNVQGNMAWEAGKTTAHVTGEDGAMQTVAGHYLVVLELDRGQWRIKALSVANDAPGMGEMKEKMAKPSKM